jgi:hypothetical protein
MRVVTHEKARRVAVRAQLLDGSATGVLDTSRQLGFLQLDQIATAAPVQQLVLWKPPRALTILHRDRCAATLGRLADWLGAVRIRVAGRRPRHWASAPSL